MNFLEYTINFKYGRSSGSQHQAFSLTFYFVLCTLYLGTYLCTSFKNLLMKTLINSFRIVALLEGISYILLLFVAVPIKYFGNDPQYVKLLGMPHGLLFIAYIILAIMVNSELNWKGATLRNVLLASIIPFGTFVVDKKYLKDTQLSN